MDINQTRFTAKEIDFLKSGSGDATPVVAAPDRYVSDLIYSEEKTPGITAFQIRLDQAPFAENGFACCAFRLAEGTDPDQIKKAGTLLETFFAEQESGFWEKLDDNVFAAALTGYPDPAEGRKKITRLRQLLCEQVETPLYSGACFYPFREYPAADILDCAVMALDHAGFFSGEDITFFDATSLNICGDRLFQRNRVEDAMLKYKKGLEIEPDNINLINSFGVCFGITGRLESAKAEFEKINEIDPEEIMAIYNLGLVFSLLKDTENAVACLQRAHRINSGLYEIELLLGNLLFRRDDHESALAHLENALRINPDSAAPLRVRGDIFLEMDRPGDAEKEFNRSIKLNPSDAASLSGLARAFEIQNKNIDIALTFARKSTDIDPSNPLFRERLARIHLKREEHEKATLEFEKANTEQQKTQSA